MQSLFAELGEYLMKQYFNQDLPVFEHLPNTLSSLGTVSIIAAVLLGILLACFAFVFQKRVIGGLPRRLIAAGALSEETAKPLSEMSGRASTAFLRLALKSQTGTLRRFVRFVGQKDLTYEELTQKRNKGEKRPKLSSPPSDALYYVPEEKAEEAKARYNEKGNNWGTFAATTAITVVLFFVICRFLPQILSAIDGICGLFGG